LSPRVRRRGGLALLLAVFVALAATAAFAAIGERRAPDGASARALTSGALSMSDSRDDQAIFTASNLAPGGSVTGTVTIANTGTITGSLALSAALERTSGPGGQALLGALALRISDVTDGAVPVVFAGPVDGPSGLALATLGPGDARTYRFSASLPDGGASPDDAGDNLLQHASLSIAYDWTLTQTTEPPAPAAPASGASPPAALPAGGSAANNAPIRPAPRPSKACRRRLTGGARGDRLVGTSAADRIYGRGGADRISGRGGNDCLWGGTGNDRIRAGAGADRVHGSSGNDVLTGNSGRDSLWGGLGADLIYARDGERDTIDCGPGRDRAVVDRVDRVRHCERVQRPRRRR
jgi:Ca2+-binding RTX toxin-like protein